MTSSDVWSAEEAEGYDEASRFMYEPHVLDPAVDFLAELAGDGRALEFAIGTGRVAIPLIDRGVPVFGIELSRAMVDQLEKKRRDVPVVVGDMETSTVAGEFSLVYSSTGAAPRTGRPQRHRPAGRWCNHGRHAARRPPRSRRRWKEHVRQEAERDHRDPGS